MREILKNEILDVVLNSNEPDYISYKLSAVLSKYDIQLACKEMIPWSYELPSC